MRVLVALLAALAVACGSDPPATTDGGNGDGGPTDDGMSSCPPGQWCVETSPVSATLLHDVWAVSAGDVFAVGDGGTILRRQNNIWTAMASGTTMNLRGVWGASATNVWAVGEGGTILRFDGNAWSPLGGVTADIHAVWGSGDDNVFVITSGMVFQWNGSSFTGRPIPGSPTAIFGSGANDVWITGEGTRVARYDGAWTTGIDPGAGATYFSILALAPDDVWIATFIPGMETLHFNGSSWTAHAAAGTAFVGLHAVSSNEIWGSGGTKVGRWNGSEWTVETPAGSGVQLFGAHGAGTYLWIVGTDSLILHRN